MYWIAISFVLFLIYLAKQGVTGVVNYANSPERVVSHDKLMDVRMRFVHQTSLSDDEKWRIHCEIENHALKSQQLIVEFMGDGDQDWDRFYFHPNGGCMVEAARMGKLWDDGRTMGYNIGRLYPLEPSPVRKQMEMTEKFLLKIEEELKRHGVNAMIMADYHEGDFASVSRHVSQYGYGNMFWAGRHSPLRFCWAPYTNRWESPAPRFWEE